MSKADGSPLQWTWKESKQDEPKMSQEKKTKVVEKLKGQIIELEFVFNGCLFFYIVTREN